MSVRVERAAPRVVELIMDRPEALNAISTEQAQALAEACAELAADDGVGVVIMVSSLSKAFSVGADLKERNGFDDDDLRRQRPLMRAAFAGVRELPMPTIAAVEGFALGGGCELALSCDLVVASATAVFGLPEVSVGLVPGGGGTQLLPRRIGWNAAADLIMTARRVNADEALRLGLVDRVVDAGQARSAAQELAATIAAHSPVSLRAAKKALRLGFDADLATGLVIEGEQWEEAAFSADRREGIAAFNAKRAPVWPGWGQG